MNENRGLRPTHAPTSLRNTTPGATEVDQRYDVTDCGRHQVEAWAVGSSGEGAGHA